MNIKNNNNVSKPQRLGIFGGTFDPIHHGHIQCAEHIASWLNIEQILLLPCHLPPHKRQVNASAKQRAEMLTIICQQHARFVLDPQELNKASTSYTVETLRAFKTLYPNSVLHFIIGMDSLLSFTQWHLWQEILQLCHLVVCTRPGYPSKKNQLKALSQYITQDVTTLSNNQAGCIIISPELSIDISSSAIRKNIHNKRPYQHLVPTEIVQYIEKNNLYL